MKDELETRRLFKKAHELLAHVNRLMDGIEARLAKAHPEKKAA